MRNKRASRTKVVGRTNFFGPPPVLEGEDEAAYDRMFKDMFDVVRPTDFIEKIWVCDLTDTAWNILRLRRIQTAYLSDKVRNAVNDKVSSIAAARPDLMEGPEKEEMARLLSSDTELSWEELCAQNPHANKKYQKFWASARETLNTDAIQADVMINEIDIIERLEHLVRLEEQRFDTVIREIDRRRATQKLLDGGLHIEEAQFKSINPTSAIRKITNKKVA